MMRSKQEILEMYHETQLELARAHDAHVRLTDDFAKIESDYAKKIKDVDRLEKANKKQMQTIDALKKQITDKEIERERYARETALRFALAVNVTDIDMISQLAINNYRFITNTLKEEIQPSPSALNDDSLTFEV